MTMFEKLRDRGRKREPMNSGPTPLATLDAEDLHKFREQRRTIADQARLLAMLQVCYNSFLVDVQAKYKVPETISVNIQTGEIREVEVEKPDV